MIKAVDLRKGKVVLHEGELWTVHEIHRTERGNLRSYMQCKFKSIKSGRMSDFRLSTDDRIETPNVDEREYEFLYREGDSLVVMDPNSYDQMHVPLSLNSDAMFYLKGNERLKVLQIGGEMVGMELPNTVELAVQDTSPVMKGATATNQAKDALMETGLKIRVPPFIENGEVIRIDTRTGEYIERAKT
jgi:elongation factor P